MAKTHVEPGSTWTEEEERAVYDGYIRRIGLDAIASSFPTDRQFESIRMKFANHVWEDTNGRQGLRGSNKWVKARWVQYRKNAVLYADEQIKSLREEEADLQSRLRLIQYRLKAHENRLQEVLTLPN